MKTNIDLNQGKNGQFLITVKRIDGVCLDFVAHSTEQAAMMAHFLIEAFSQEHIDGINAAHKIVERTLDAMDTARGLDFAQGKSH